MHDRAWGGRGPDVGLWHLGALPRERHLVPGPWAYCYS